jgi:hypothetical protein
MLFQSIALLALVATAANGLPHRRFQMRADSDSGSGSDPADMAPSTAPGNATAGCSQASSWDFDDTNHANITMGDRSFLVHIPANYNPTTPHALVLSFHGFKANAKKQELITGLSEKGLTLNGKVGCRSRGLKYKLLITTCFRVLLPCIPMASSGQGRTGMRVFGHGKVHPTPRYVSISDFRTYH